jgi:hypothetical protein
MFQDRGAQAFRYQNEQLMYGFNLIHRTENEVLVPRQFQRHPIHYASYPSPYFPVSLRETFMMEEFKSA